MITDAYLDTQVQQSVHEGKCTPFLCHFIFSIVHQSLSSVYGDNYSIRCVQSSIAIQTLLESLSIQSRVWSGAVCMAKASRNSPVEYGWAGFWGDDQHAWTVTQFLELVDLTISQLHIHPARSTNIDEPIPALWWHPIDHWPPIIHYLPDGLADVSQFPRDESMTLNTLLSTALDIKSDLMTRSSVDEIAFNPLLFGIDHMQELHDGGHPWLNKCIYFQDRHIPIPPWVQLRELELKAKYSTADKP